MSSSAKLYHSMENSSLTDQPTVSQELPAVEKQAGEAAVQAPGQDLLACLEALLFVSPGAVTPAQLAAALDIPLTQVEQGLDELNALYTQEGPARGLRLQHYRGRVQLTTAPQVAGAIERFLGLEASSRLSRAALETLAIVLYRQPVTRPAG